MPPTAERRSADTPTSYAQRRSLSKRFRQVYSLLVGMGKDLLFGFGVVRALENKLLGEKGLFSKGNDVLHTIVTYLFILKKSQATPHP